MNGPGLVEALASWWRGGEAMMPAILGVGLILYGRLGAMAFSPERDFADVDRDVRLVGVLAAALPLLGLLGTVTGMVRTFADLAASGGSGIDAAAGIGIALTTTQYGVALALPALVAAALVRRWAAMPRSRPC